MRLNDEKKKNAGSIVLMFDDDAATRQKIRKILSGQSRIIDSIDPDTLCETYQQYLPSIVLMDMRTSLKNGHDAVKEILAYDPEAFIVLMSSDCTQQSIMQSKERGARGFIGKPFQREILLKYMTLAATHKARQIATVGTSKA